MAIGRLGIVLAIVLPIVLTILLFAAVGWLIDSGRGAPPDTGESAPLSDEADQESA
jgi:hypothetical protein